MASNSPELMDSEDILPAPNPPKLHLTKLEAFNFVKEESESKGQKTKAKFKNATSKETLKGLLCLMDSVQLPSEDPILGDAINHEAKRAKLTIKTRMIHLLNKHKGRSYKWDGDENDIFIRLTDFPLLVPLDFENVMDQQDSEGFIPTQASAASAASTASTRSDLEEECPPPPKSRKKKAWEQLSRAWKRQETQDLYDHVLAKSKELNIDPFVLICYLGHRLTYMEDKKMAEHFESLASKEFSPEMDIELATHLKFMNKLPDRNYSNVRYLLKDHVDIPTVKRVQKHATSLLPNVEWNKDIPNGMCAEVVDVLKGTLERLPDHVNKDIIAKNGHITGCKVRVNSGVDASGGQRYV